MSSYCGNVGSTWIDGTHIFQTAADEKKQDEVASFLSDKWNCKVHSFGALSPIDWWFERGGRLVGIGELKCRSMECTKYETTFLEAKKWLTLYHAQEGLSVPALLVISYVDCLTWIPVSEVDATRTSIVSRKKRDRERSGVDLMIEIPTISLRVVL